MHHRSGRLVQQDCSPCLQTGNTAIFIVLFFQLVAACLIFEMSIAAAVAQIDLPAVHPGNQQESSSDLDRLRELFCDTE